MEIKTKTSIENLTADTVVVVRQRYIVIDGVETKVGSAMRNSYINSPDEREMVKNLVSDEFYNAVIAVWGDNTTVETVESEE